MCIMPLGLFIFGWTAGRTHWIGPQMGQAVTCYGLMLAFNSIQVGPSLYSLTLELHCRRVLPVLRGGDCERDICELF